MLDFIFIRKSLLDDALCLDFFSWKHEDIIMHCNYYVYLSVLNNFSWHFCFHFSDFLIQFLLEHFLLFNFGTSILVLSCDFLELKLRINNAKTEYDTLLVIFYYVGYLNHYYDLNNVSSYQNFTPMPHAHSIIIIF